MNLSAPPHPRRYQPEYGREVRFGVLCCVVAVAIQYRQHALIFQQPDPIAASQPRGATQTTSEVNNPLPSTYRRGGLPARHANSTQRHPSAVRHRAHHAKGLRAKVAHSRVHRALRVNGRGASLQRREPGAVADQRDGASVGVVVAGRP